VCVKKNKPAPTGERDLFGFEIDKACEAALFHVELHIAVAAGVARRAIRMAFTAARERARERMLA
jgi:hypothetical protein